MTNTFDVKVVTPEGPVLAQSDVTFARVPGSEGEVGVYPNHSPTITKLSSGAVIVQTEDSDQQFYLSRGIAHIEKESITILTPFLETKSKIDIDRAKNAQKRAEERLNARKSDDIDRDRAQLSLNRAKTRLKIALG